MEYADRLEHDELSSVIDQEIDRLRESHRLPVVLCCLEGISHEEAAAAPPLAAGHREEPAGTGKKTAAGASHRQGVCPVGGDLRSGRHRPDRRRGVAAVPPALLDATPRPPRRLRPEARSPA